MLRRLAKRIATRVFNSQLFRDTLRNAILSDEFRQQLRQGQLDLLNSPDFRTALKPHLLELALNPDLRGIDAPGNTSRVNRGVQLLLNEQWRGRLSRQDYPQRLAEVGYRCFSPNDEDGIVQYLLLACGVAPTRRVIEFGCGSGYECLAANLLVNHGYQGLLITDARENLPTAKLFYETRHETCGATPRLLYEKLEDTIVDLVINNNGFSGEVDLLSIDLNGIDYWVWKSLNAAQPRIVAVKYHPVWPADQAKTIPNIKNFSYSTEKPGYYGASLAAYGQLAKEKNYRFVGSNGLQSVAFFVRNDLASSCLPAVPLEQGLDGTRVQLLQQSLKSQLNPSDWVTV